MLTHARHTTSRLSPCLELLGVSYFAICGFFRPVGPTRPDFLFRAKVSSNAMKLPLLNKSPEESHLSSAAGQRVRGIDVALTVTTEATTQGAEYRLDSSMLDPSGFLPIR